MFHVLLYEPEIPPNTGNVIRLCANMGATLHLIEPLGFRLDDKRVQRAGLDYHELARVRVHASLDDCLQVLADSRVFAVETGGCRRYSDVDYRAGDAFLFGPETRGLPEQVLGRMDAANSVFIPMMPGSRSINLSNAVAIVAFEVWRKLGFEGHG